MSTPKIYLFLNLLLTKLLLFRYKVASEPNAGNCVRNHTVAWPRASADDDANAKAPVIVNQPQAC